MESKMSSENKCFEVTYIVTCRVFQTPNYDYAKEVAREFRCTFDKGNLADYSGYGNIESFKGTIHSIHKVPLKHPYKDGKSRKGVYD